MRLCLHRRGQYPHRGRAVGQAEAIVVGAGPAGLASAMAMRAAGFEVAVFEKADSVGAVWRRHYDRLHLHTDRKHSGLPGMAMPPTYLTYPSREQVVEYLESYATRFAIRPVFNTALRARSARLSQLSRQALPMRRIARLGRVRRLIENLSFTAANIAIRSLSRENACWSSALAIRAVRLPWTWPMPASTSLLRFAVRFKSCRAIFSAFRSWHGRSSTGHYPREWSISSTLRSCGWRSVRSKNWDCAVPPKVRAKWSMRMGGYR